MKYRVVVEATRKIDSDKLLFGFSRKASSTNVDWIGSAFVMADSPEEAERRFSGFFRENATEWSFDGKPEPVESLEAWELDFQVVEERDHLWRFEQGEVVAGWGM